MRFQKVIAHAFGPFRERTLDLAPGMTVVFGPNEAGKSTWHAAVYAALCGIRRGRGAQRTNDREFSDRHRPWDGEGWDVSARVELEDGRRIEIRQDLDGKIDCRATDLDLGRDVSAEIIHEGSPDGSRWLGLDREAFFATACVFQAALISVHDDAAVLQEHLQRATDTAGKDETAAEALEAIEAFSREHVGSDRANSRGPLRRVNERLQQLRDEVNRARDGHANYLRLVEQAEAKGAECEGLRVKEMAAKRVLAREQAKALFQRLARLRALAAKFADGPPPSPSTGGEVTRRVAAAIEAWRNRPAVPELQGPTAEDLKRQLAELPPTPQGDLALHQRVIEATARLGTVEALLANHDGERPTPPSAPETGGATAQELRSLAHELEQPEPAVDPSLLELVEAARAEVDRTRPSERRRIPIAAACASLVVGGVIGAFGYALTGLAVAVVGLLAALAMVLTRDSAAHEQALSALREAESSLGVQEQLRTSIATRRENARQRANSLGLSADPLRLADLARQLESAAQSMLLFERWQARLEDLGRDLDRARGDVQRALCERGCEPGPDLQQSLTHYREECVERARLAAEAARAPDIRDRLASRQAAERAAADARAAVDRALTALQAAAAECNVPGATPEEIMPELERWLARISAEVKTREALALEYNELELALAGRDAASAIGEMESRFSELDTAARQVLDAAVEEPADARTAGVLLSAVEGQLRTVKEQLHSLRGAVEERGRRLPSVADAEEELAEAERELARVQRLESTLSRTHKFLASAQERVHRDIAQVLAGSVRPWLPQITSGRYEDVAVDPSHLAVQVKDSAGHWRDATLLSHGTTEQIYLLLRVALAKHLTKKGERCPLLLDEVTVQSDRERTARILDLLHALSAEHQIVLFTQEEDVRDWARASLGGERDRIIELAGAAA